MWTKPAARMPRGAWAVQDCFQVGTAWRGAGPVPGVVQDCRTVEAATGWPSLTSSPCTRRVCPCRVPGGDADHEFADRGGRRLPAGTPSAGQRGSPFVTRPGQSCWNSAQSPTLAR